MTRKGETKERGMINACRAKQMGKEGSRESKSGKKDSDKKRNLARQKERKTGSLIKTFFMWICVFQ